MSFERLKKEYDTVGIGNDIYALLREMCGLVSRNYPVDVYNSGEKWIGSGVDDLCQQVALEHLIGRKQLDYIFAEAKNLDSVKRLFVRQIQRTLADRRSIGPVDRLLTRTKNHAKDKSIGSFIDVRSGLFSFASVDQVSTAEPLSKQKINDCVDLLRDIPVLYTRLDSSRESMVYTPESLLRALSVIFKEVGSVTDSDLRQIFEKLLTPWLGPRLIGIDEIYTYEESPSFGAAGEQQLRSAANRFLEKLSLEEKIVILFKSNDVSDGEIASQINKSRPTVAKMKIDGLSRVKSEFLAGIEPDLQNKAVSILLDQITIEVEGANS